MEPNIFAINAYFNNISQKGTLINVGKRVSNNVLNFCTTQ